MTNVKLTAKQEVTMNLLHNSNAIYKVEGKDITEDLFINGVPAGLEIRTINGNKLVARKQNAYYINNYEILIKGHTSTIKALEKKGLITIIEIGGTAFDKVVVVNKSIETFEILSKIEITLDGKNKIIYSNVGEEELAVEGFNQLRDVNYSIVSIDSVDCQLA